MTEPRETEPQRSGPPHTEQLRTRRIYAEILIVLTVTFGISGVRAALRLADALLNPAPLNEQSVTLNGTQSTTALLDLGLQLCSAAVLFAWGALGLYLLGRWPRVRSRDWWHGMGLAAVIGLPGLAFYLGALHFGLTKEVVPAAFDNAWVELPTLLLKSAGNAFAEEIIVVMWLCIRLRQARWGVPAAIAASAILRGSYHLYQGVSAGLGNIAMGVVYAWYFHKTGRVWPLIIGHFLIDAIAFCGYALLF
ncbi:CPBP family intramembrane glutamic endopeptidase [Corynebacterium sp.]|uniref:CPBP family intramembrane glutamic endopeptidase n=1 Tax=Corynebacterium sp. TaxID=1720 RepID=UPI0026DC0465|nr:CPBP family intramembrane glutamic endopeptidase [Corynebacterium sp.]MDO5032967.1 CPBP family intramembrane metalloprotease [Corynebacterium sp.]